MPRPTLTRTFFLGFHERPPAKDVYGNDTIVYDNEEESRVIRTGMKLTVKPGRSPATYEVIVIATGTKARLSKLLVDKEGRVFEPDDPEAAGRTFVGTPFQERQLLKRISNSALREQHLADVATGIVSNGPTPDEIPRKKVCRLPKKLTDHEKAVLQQKVDSLPCWTQKNGDLQVVQGTPVFLNGGAINLVKGDHQHSPTKLFTKVIHMCLGDLVHDKGLCSTVEGGKHRGKVAVPPQFLEAAYGYCTLTCGEEKVKFEPSYILRNYLNKQSKKTPTTAESTAVVVVAPEIPASETVPRTVLQVASVGCSQASETEVSALLPEGVYHVMQDFTVGPAAPSATEVMIRNGAIWEAAHSSKTA